MPKLRLRLPKVAQKYPVAFGIAVGLHIIFLVILWNYQDNATWETPQIKPKVTSIKSSKPIPQGVAVDFDLIEQEKKRILDKKLQQQLALKKQQQELKLIEEQKKRALAKHQEAQKKRKIEEEAIKEAQRKKQKEQIAVKRALAKKKAAEKKRKVEEEATQKALAEKQVAEKKRKAEEEATKKALAAKQVAEKKRQAEELKLEKIQKSKQLLETKIKQTQQALTASVKRFKEEKIKHELNRDLAQEEIEENKLLLDRQLRSLKGDYIALIAADVRKNWRASRLFKTDWQCSVLVKQNQQGKVLAVNITSCNHNSTGFKRSVESAIFKASPLPLAPVPEAFDQIIQFEFKPIQ